MKREILSESDINAFARDANADYGSNDSIREGVPASGFQRIEDLPRIEDVASANVEWIVEGLVPQGTVILMTGDFGSGKSTLASALAFAVSNGQEFLGRRTAKRPALILDADNPAIAVLDRFRRIGIETSDDFRVWGQWTGEDPPSADDTRILEWIARQEHKPLMLVDCFIAFQAESENDSVATRAHLAKYRRLAASGATVIVLHHIGQDAAKQYRGSSDIPAAVDIAYKLTNLGDPARLSQLELRAFKQRVTVTPRLLIRYQDGRFAIDDSQAIQTGQEALTELLKQNPGVSCASFEKLAGDRKLGRNRARKFLKSGIESGSVRIERVGNRTMHRLRDSANGNSTS